MRAAAAVALAFALAGACGRGAVAGRDATPGVDGEVDAAPAGSDTADAAPADGANVDADRDGGPDGAADGPVEPFVAITPCSTPSAYADGTRAITTTAGDRYSPACLRVPVGTTVTIEASTAHPLEPRAGGSPNNPIPSQTTTATISFPTSGFYPFLCPEHVDQGMVGVVWVTDP